MPFQEIGFSAHVSVQPQVRLPNTLGGNDDARAAHNIRAQA